MKKYIKYGLWTVAGVVALVAAAVAYIALTFDPNAYKPQIIKAVKESKQRTLKLDGDIKLHFFPSIGVSLGGVSLSEFQSEQVFVFVDSARVSLKLLPLLAKQLVVDEVSVSGAKAQVIKYKNGKTNLDDLMSKESAKPEPVAPVAEAGAPMQFDIAAVVLENTEFGYRDEMSGANYSVKNLNLKTGRIASGVPCNIDFAAQIQSSQPKLDIAAQIKTTVTFDLEKGLYQVQDLDLQANGQALDITDLVVKAGGDASAHPSAQEFSLKKFTISASGVKGKDKEKFEAKLDAPSLSLTKDKFTSDSLALNAKLDGAIGKLVASISLPGIEGDARAFKVGAVALNLDVKQPEQSFALKLTSPLTGSIEAKQFNLSDLRLALNASGDKLPGKSISSEMKGSIQTDLSRQSIQGNLAGGLLQSQLKAKLAVNNFSVPVIRYDLEIDQFDADPYLPKKTAEAKEQDKKAEPEQPFDLSALKKLNVEGSLRIGSLKAANVKVAQLRIDVKARNGTVNIAPFSAKLYQGSMDSKITVDASKAQPGFAANVALSGIELGPLLNDAMKMDFISGKGNVALNVETQGNLVSLLKKNLGGKASVALVDGAVKGINLAKSVREFGKSGAAKSQAANKEEQTDFSEFKASFKIAKGIAHNDDLSLKSPFIRVGGKGDINIGNDSLDYLVKATIAGTMEGQGGKDSVGGVTVPVRLSGPYTALNYKLEFGEMVSDAAKQKVQAASQKAKDNAKSKAQDELKKGLKGLFK